MAKHRRLESTPAARLVHLFLILFYLYTLMSAKQDEFTPCGDFSIRSPLRLKGDPSYCGDPNPNFELTCDSSNHTFLNLFFAKFYVESISSLVDPYLSMHVTDVKMEQGGCSLPQPSMTFTKLMSSNFPYDKNVYSWAWATFMNCSKEVKNNPMYSPVSCLSQNDTFIYVIISPDDQAVKTVGDLVTSCSFLSMTPVDPDLVGLNLGYPYFDPSLKRVNLVNCTKECWDSIQDQQAA